MKDMKKYWKLIFVYLSVISLNAYSQVSCPNDNTDISDNPFVCGLYGNNNGNSNWNWEITEADDNYCKHWVARIGNDANLTLMRSPFVNPQTSALKVISSEKDYAKEKGWELLQRNFGCGGNVAYPYFILYNKYTGIMRVFIYQAVTAPQYSSVLLQMEPTNAPFPATTSLGDGQITAPDKYSNSSMTSTFGIKVISVTEDAGNSNWRMGEFSMGFDPNIVAYSNAAIKITMYGITSSTVKAKIKGRGLSGTEPTIYNFGYATTSSPEPDGNGQKFKTAGEKFVKFSKTITDSRDGVNKAAQSIINSMPNTLFDSSMQGRIKKIASVAKGLTNSNEGFGQVLGTIGSAIGGAGHVLNLIGGVIGFFSGGNGKPAPMPTYMSYEEELSGEIKTSAVSQTFIIKVPGPTVTDNNNLTYYKCPLGIFNITNTPQADKVTYERNMLIFPPRIASFVSYRMRNNLEASYNSGAGLELVSAQAAIIGEVKGDASADNNAYYDLLADHEWAGGAMQYNFMLPDLQAGILEVAAYDPVKKLHTFQTPYVNLECLNGLTFNARAETSVFLRVKAILKKKNDPDNTPIYFIRDYKIEPVDGVFDEELRSRHRGLHSASTPTPYSNYAELPTYIPGKTISNVTYTTSVEEKTDNTITTEGNVTVTAGQNVLFKTGYEIALEGEFTAEVGSEFEAALKISQVNRPCGTRVWEAYQYIGNCYNVTASALRSATNSDKPNQNISEETIKVYPVPTNGKLFISGITDSKNAIITILDQSGRTVRELRSASFEAAGLLNLDVSGLQNGVYFVKIQTRAHTITKKIVVNKYSG